MPRRKHTKRRASGKGSNVVTMSGRALLTLSYSASFSFTDQLLRPSDFDRLSQVRQAFELYRFTHFSFKALPACTGTVVMAYLDGSNVTSLAGLNASNVIEYANSVSWFNGQTVPIHLRVGRSRINSQYKWLPTNNALGPTGHLVIGGPMSTAVTIVVDVRYTCQFKQPVAYGFQSIPRVIEETKGDEDELDDLDPFVVMSLSDAKDSRVKGGHSVPVGADVVTNLSKIGRTRP